MMDNAIVSVIALVIVFLFTLVPLTFSSFNTSQTMREQYSLMGTYFMMNNHLSAKRPYQQTSNDVIIVDVANVYDRDTLVNIIDMIGSSGPAAIGLDVFFAERMSDEADDRLSYLAGQKNVISPIILQGESRSKDASFRYALYPFYMDAASSNAGFVNVATSGASQTCRTFSWTLQLDTTEVQNFNLALLRASSESAYAQALARGNKTELINYCLNSFSIYSAESVSENLDVFKDKVVLIGDREDISDRHVTPLDLRTPGVDIHAMIMATMLEGKYINEMSEAGAWILAFAVIFLFLPILQLLKKNSWMAIFAPIFQFFMIILAIFICFIIFISFGYYVRVVYSLIALGFVDVSYNLYEKIRETCVRLFSR